MNIINKVAYTLVELMVVVAVVTIALFGVYALMSAGEKSWLICDRRARLQQDLRKVVDIIVTELNQSASSRILIGSDGKSIKLLFPVQATGLPDEEDITLNAKADYSQETINYAYPDPLTQEGAEEQVEWGAYERFKLWQGQNKTVTYFHSPPDKTIVRRVQDGAGNVIEDFIVARSVEYLNFSLRAGSSTCVQIEVSSRISTVKVFPISFSIVTATHCENG